MGETTGETACGTPRLPDVLTGIATQLSELTDVGDLTEEEALAVVTAAERVKASVAAVQARACTEFVTQRDAEVARDRAAEKISRREAGQRQSAARSEVALARRCSPFQADRHIAHGRALCSVLPHTMAALTAGDLSEHRAEIIARETTCLSPQHRREVDARVADTLPQLGDKALTAAVQRACIDVDQASIVERRRRAAEDRCVSIRPAPDGMARLSVLGPLADVVGAYASLRAAEAARWVATGDPEVDAARAADERGRGAWLADTALERLSGRAEGQAQPVEVGLVISDTALFPSAGTGSEGEYVEVPGWGAIPAADARDHLLRLLDEDHPDADDAKVWLRRLFTSPDGRDLVAMDSRRRFFTGALRSLIELRDPTCRIPWCDAPTREVDHARSAAAGGPTSTTNALGLCQRHNLTKESPGWRVSITGTGLDPGGGPHAALVSTPTGNEFTSVAAPLLGHGRVRGRPVRAARPATSTIEVLYAGALHTAA